MKHERVISLTDSFQSPANRTDGGVEFWLARDLQHRLGYSKWDNPLNVVSKARAACEVSGHEAADHFAGVGRMVGLGSGSQREVDDLMLTRCACYLIAQNDASRKAETTFAKNCIALRTQSHDPRRHAARCMRRARAVRSAGPVARRVSPIDGALCGAQRADASVKAGRGRGDRCDARALRDLDSRQCSPYAAQHIRPLVVGPLDHPERVPRPWGFFFSGAARADGARS